MWNVTSVRFPQRFVYITYKINHIFRINFFSIFSEWRIMKLRNRVKKYFNYKITKMLLSKFTKVCSQDYLQVLLIYCLVSKSFIFEKCIATEIFECSKINDSVQRRVHKELILYSQLSRTNPRRLTICHEPVTVLTREVFCTLYSRERER